MPSLPSCRTALGVKLTNNHVLRFDVLVEIASSMHVGHSLHVHATVRASAFACASDSACQLPEAVMMVGTM